ncbi:MAG: DegT/DnrJ/EryC1/StrS family aminotransferase [Asgard group archaeon]
MVKLAIEGGEPIRREKIPIALPILGEEEERAVIEVLRSGYLVQGEVVEKFEKEFGKFNGVNHAIAVNSGTAALHVALQALKLLPGDEVITAPYTFSASATAALFLGGIPVFVDINTETFNIEPEKIEKAITRKTKGIIPVHLFGLPADMDPIKEVAEKHDLFILEDAAQAHKARYKSHMVGTFGDVAIYSFYATKNMTTGEGGMIVTDDDEIAEKCRIIRDQGQKGKYNHVLLGYNYRMTNIMAAIGLKQLEKLQNFTEKRQEFARKLSKELEKIEELIKPPKEPEGHEHVYYLYACLLEEKSGWKRDDFIKALEAEGISAHPIYTTLLYQQPLYENIKDPNIYPYAEMLKNFLPNYKKVKCPIAEEIAKKAIQLPMHPKLTEKDLKDITTAIEKLIQQKKK